MAMASGSFTKAPTIRCRARPPRPKSPRRTDQSTNPSDCHPRLAPERRSVMRMRTRGRVLAAEHKATADMAGYGSSSYARMSVCRTLTRVIGSIFPLREAVADNFHCSHCSVAQARVAGDLPAHALAFAPKHVAYALQFKNHPVDFFDRGT